MELRFPTAENKHQRCTNCDAQGILAGPFSDAANEDIWFCVDCFIDPTCPERLESAGLEETGDMLMALHHIFNELCARDAAPSTVPRIRHVLVKDPDFPDVGDYVIGPFSNAAEAERHRQSHRLVHWVAKRLVL